MLDIIKEVLASSESDRLVYFVNLDPVDDISSELDQGQSINDTVTVSYS